MHADFVGQVGGLQADADAVFELVLLFVGIEAEHAHIAGGALADAFENLDGGGFARAVGTEQAEDFAGLDFEIDAADSFEVAVAFVETVNGNGQRVGHGLLSENNGQDARTCSVIRRAVELSGRAVGYASDFAAISAVMIAANSSSGIGPRSPRLR